MNSKTIRRKHKQHLFPASKNFYKDPIVITKGKNVLPVSLGERVLRSDTAITVALFCIQELLSQ